MSLQLLSALAYIRIDDSCTLTATCIIALCIIQDRQKRLSIANYDTYDYNGSGGSGGSGVDPVTPDPGILPFKEYVTMSTSYIQVP